MSSFILRTGRLCNWNINSNMEACFNPRKFPFFGIECFESSSNFPNFQLQATNPESQFKKLRLGVALFVSWHEMNYGTRKLVFKKMCLRFFFSSGNIGRKPILRPPPRRLLPGQQQEQLPLHQLLQQPAVLVAAIGCHRQQLPPTHPRLRQLLVVPSTT